MNEWITYGLCFFAGLFVATVIAIIIARRKQDSSADDREITSLLLKGSYKLLEDNFKEAEKDFHQVALLKQDDPYTHFVLGRLFRKTGQLRRAVRVHRNLSVRHDDKNGRVKSKALFELGEDFVAGNLNEQAITIFKDLVAAHKNWQEPLARLVELLLVDRQWLDAFENLKHLERLSGHKQNVRAAHILCQAASDEIEADCLKSAKRLLNRALKRQAKSAHVAFLYAKLHNINNKPENAFRALKEALDYNKRAADIVLPKMLELNTVFDFDEQIDNLLNSLDTDQTLTQSTAIFRAMRLFASEKNQEAKEIVKELIANGNRNPQVFTLADSLNMNLESICATSFVCSNCKQKTKTLDWFCINCGEFETYF